MTKMLIATAAVLAAILYLASCGNESSTNPAGSEPLVRTTPAGGSVNIDPDEPIHMMFNEPVDTADFHQWFYCLDSLAHDALHDSLTGGMMGMGHHHDDSAAFYQRMHGRSVRGEFMWNSLGDSCVFAPDSALMHGTEYILRFRTQMQNHVGHRMRHMGMTPTDDLTVRFRTRSQTGG